VSSAHLAIAQLEQNVDGLIVFKVPLELDNVLVVQRAVDADLRHQLCRQSKFSGLGGGSLPAK